MTNEIETPPSGMEKKETLLQKLSAGYAGKFIRKNWVNYAFIFAFIILLVVTASMSEVFFTQRNLSNLMRQTVTNGLLSLGMLNCHPDGRH